MIDKNLEINIKKTKNFIEIWNEFHRIFKNMLLDNTLNKEAEKNFLSTKTLVNARYDDLMDSLGVKPIGRFIKSEPIYDVLSLENLSIISDERLKEVRQNWEESSRHLGALLERLEKKKRRIEGFNSFAFGLKKKLTKVKSR